MTSPLKTRPFGSRFWPPRGQPGSHRVLVRNRVLSGEQPVCDVIVEKVSDGIVEKVRDDIVEKVSDGIVEGVSDDIVEEVSDVIVEGLVKS